MQNDLTFFTNTEEHDSLLGRFKSTLVGVQYFDILVGYFRTSGFKALSEELKGIEQIRILVGLNVDYQTFEIVDQHRLVQQELDLLSSQETKEKFDKQLSAEMAAAADSYDTELGVKTFIEMLQAGQIQIKAHPSQNIHAKVYIQRFDPQHAFGTLDYGRVITGSSNFSFSGLKRQHEFNVELKNKADVVFALERFEELWEQGIDLSEQYIDTIRKRTWLNDQIKPYELYLKFLYEYFKEEINVDDDIAPFLPDGFMELAYQKQAVISAKRILDIYGGVFLADVVGLGKTFISALLAQQLDRGHILIICPPVLKDYWEDTFRDFRVPATVESLGKLDRIITKGHSKFKYVFIDEAHRFRNEDTQRYEALHQICWGKKVILVSATPLNNKIDDIFSQLKLFQAPRKSIIPGVPNLEIFFQRLNQRLKGYEKDDPNYVREVKAVATEVRTKILRHVMVRRTRSEIQRFYAEDMHAQGLTFPQIADPQRIVYKFDTAVERVFKQTIAMLREFNYARYTPRLYLREDLTEFEKQSQRNIGAFMKGLLVKRLESSFYAFRNTLRRFIESYERFIEMYESGRVLISTDFDVYDLLEVDNEERLQQLIVLGEVDEFLQGDFQPQFRQKLDRDLQLLHDVQQLWNTITTDPKREQFIADLHDHNLLKGQKLIIFSESAETVDYLYKGLQAAFPNEVMAFTSGGGRYAEQGYGSQAARDLIEANYDPRHKNKQNNIRLLVTTDVLAEGINLHRSHIVVNYDLPWNPTRVLQRVGRVNRVGTEHPLVYIFNFFPTAQSDEHLGLENNIVSKIQAFHDMLGEDARYLSDVEEVTQHDLSGRSRALYRRLNQRETFIGEDAEEERSDLEYLQIIRRVRDEQPKLFEKLKTMPVKARSGWQTAAHQEGLTAHNDLLVTFFRIGRLKRFFASTIHDTLELDFFEAVDLLACEPDTKRLTIPKIYYELLDKNKETFAEAIEAQTAPEPVVGGGHTHAKLALKNVRAALRDRQRLTDEDEAYLRVVRSAFEDGRIPSSVSKRVMQKVKKAGKRLDSLKVLQIMRDEIEDDLLYVEVQTAADAPQAKREIILSAYLIKQPQ